MMFLDEDDLEAMNRGIARMERGITHQEKIVAQLLQLGEPTHLAEKFLARLRDTLEMRRQHSDRLVQTKSGERQTAH